MTSSELELYRRGCRTLLASWDEYARGAAGARVERLPGVAIAVFPEPPERAVYNNALLETGLGAVERAEAIDAIENVYAAAGVSRFAAWVHEADPATCRGLERLGYALETSTQAMGMSLEDGRLERPELELGPSDWREYIRLLGLPPAFLARADPDAYHVLIARLDGENVATGLAFDCDGDCGIYNIATVERVRRRGIGTAVTRILLSDARRRGCRTASLQSTPIAESVYAAVGFRPLGRLFEYVPTQPRRPG
jgi:GNAT superfamily N-acetyltransferase